MLIPPPLHGHAAEARDLVRHTSSGRSPETALVIPTKALVHATLAVAHEARTANLIARWDALRTQEAGILRTAEVWAEIERLDREIHARLLPEDVTP